MQIIIDIPEDAVEEWTNDGLITRELLELGVKNTVFGYLRKSLPPNKAFRAWMIETYNKDFIGENINAIAGMIRTGFKVVADENKSK